MNLRLLVAILALFAVAFTPIYGLTVEEQTALHDIIAAWPSLTTSMDPWVDSLVYDACNQIWNGLYCSFDNHVEILYVANLFLCCWYGAGLAYTQPPESNV